MGSGCLRSAAVIILLHDPTGSHSLGLSGLDYSIRTATESGVRRVCTLAFCAGSNVSHGTPDNAALAVSHTQLMASSVHGRLSYDRSFLSGSVISAKVGIYSL